MRKLLFQSTITVLLRVSSYMAMSLSMNGKQIILSDSNIDKLKNAQTSVDKAIRILREIE